MDASLYSGIGWILDASETQFPVVLYVSTDADGTYIGQSLVPPNALLRSSVGGVAANTVTLVKLLHP